MTRAASSRADPADALAFRAAREICRRHASSFYFASAFLPQAKRDGAFAVYAFCRMIDDAIDLPDEGRDHVGAARARHRPLTFQSPPIAMGGLGRSAGAPSCCSSHPLDQRLALFRDRLDEIYDGRLELPAPASRSEAQHTLHAFSLTVHRYQIPRQYFLDFAEGRRMDLAVSRYATWSSLERHCYHVAGVVGLMMSCVFGVTHSGAAGQAIRMGSAMRLTGILRDIKEDFERGRVYLPLEDLATFRYSERDLAAGTVNENFRELMRFEIARARRLYREAAEGLCWVAGDGSRLTASTVAMVYSGILDAIERQGYDVFSRRAALTTGQKLRRLPMAWRVARRRPDAQLPPLFPAGAAAPLAAR